ncbi:antibiotic biosynthesis monooxygenase [Vibrio sp. NH-UV-68]|uniref:antibiotic biosynthesis monooxygenase family protein n=1 Tax=unclassified Vibrio TaxID=2614977 RepID=UPI0036F336D5
MFTVVYEFVIDEGTDKKFREAWIEHTEYVYQTRGSLGSRLHTTGVENTYVAYAQWPDRDRWAETTELFRDLQPSTLLEMKKYLISSSVLRELTVCDDILK